MGKIFYVMGKSSSGKDTIFRELMKEKELDLHQIVLYTTRPIRAGERDGVDYHFVDDEVLHRFQKEEKVIGCVFGNVYPGFGERIGGSYGYGYGYGAYSRAER